MVKISELIPGRTGCQLKNRWHKELRDKLRVRCSLSKQERRSKKEKYEHVENNTVSVSECDVPLCSPCQTVSLLDDQLSFFSGEQDFNIFINELCNSLSSK